MPREIIAESEESIESVIVRLLSDRHETVATAESCTGGQIANTITNAAGSSGVFHRGYVTYANSAKAELLGVPAELIVKYGAVSDEVVRAMAEGCLARSGADHALAVSGIAGPGGGSEEKTSRDRFHRTRLERTRHVFKTPFHTGRSHQF